jgi:hypothetical protein
MRAIGLACLILVLATSAPALAQEPASPDEVAALREEVARLRALVERQERALAALERRVAPASVAIVPAVAVTAPGAPAPGAPAPGAPAAPDPAVQAVSDRVEELAKRWGHLRLDGDIQLRYEGFFNQGYDLPTDAPARNRFRARVRAQLSGEIGEHFDWGIRLASGSFDNPISPQQTLTDYYDRKPIGIDRAYLHFDTKGERTSFEVYGGKFEAPWKRTPLTFDEDLQPEGFAETLRFAELGGTLRTVELTAWQLPYRERAIGADAVILGGQVLTEWRFSKAWSATLAGAYHDFEQVDVIPPAVGVSPTLVNAGFDYVTTNAVVLNAAGIPEYRSAFHVIDAIAEVRYAGLSPKWPVLVRADWIHNTTACDDLRDGLQIEGQVGRRREAGDWQFDYLFWRVEREAFPSVFMDSEMLIQTNSLTHAARARYQLHRQVELATRYFLTRRLETAAPINRWLQHFQFDVQYRF